jgi:hypothetical protein
MSSMSLPVRVAAAKILLKEAATEHDDLPAEQMVNLQEAIEFLNRLEASFPDEYSNE